MCVCVCVCWGVCVCVSVCVCVCVCVPSVPSPPQSVHLGNPTTTTMTTTTTTTTTTAASVWHNQEVRMIDPGSTKAQCCRLLCLLVWRAHRTECLVLRMRTKSVLDPCNFTIGFAAPFVFVTTFRLAGCS